MRTLQTRNATGQRFYYEVPQGKGLVQHGIFTEKSDVRVHVGSRARCFFVFRTQDARDGLANYHLAHPDMKRWTPSYIPPYGLSALSYLLPIKFCPRLMRFRWVDYPDWHLFGDPDDPEDKSPTGELGDLATAAFIRAFLANKLEIPGAPPPYTRGDLVDLINDREAQYDGYDFIIRGTIRVEVKADRRADPNLALQDYEANQGHVI